MNFITSLINQPYFGKIGDYEILIGASDGSISDSFKNTNKNIKIYKSSSNRYLILNTLFKESKYDKILVLSSTAIFMRNSLSNIMSSFTDGMHLLQLKTQEYGAISKVSASNKFYLASHDLIDNLGGYIPWDYLSEDEFISRAKMFVEPKVTPISVIMNKVDKSYTLDSEKLKIINNLDRDCYVNPKYAEYELILSKEAKVEVKEEIIPEPKIEEKKVELKFVPKKSEQLVKTIDKYGTNKHINFKDEAKKRLEESIKLSKQLF